jgi:hypothetical protein
MAGILVGITFLTLLSIRLGVFDTSDSALSDRYALKAARAVASETWMQIFQNGRKIGYAHRFLSPLSDGYGFADDVFMRINTMGVIQGVAFSTRGTLRRDMTLSTFQVQLTSNLFRFSARGTCQGRNLTLYVGEAGDEKRYDMTLNAAPHMSGHITDIAVRSGLRAGEMKTISLFDPSSMGVRSVNVSLVGEETRSVEGKLQRLTKLSVDFMGARQYAWISTEGEIIREEGILGLVLERTSRGEAMRGVSSPAAASVDMTALASIRSNVTIEKPTSLRSLRIKISHIDDRRFVLHGDRQSYQDGIVSVMKETLDKEDNPADPIAEIVRAESLRSTPFIQADHPHIRAALKEMVSDRDPPPLKLQKIVHWVHGHLEKQPILSISNAVETLARRRGDCTEHAVLVAALGRAAGIPTTVETGLMYQRGRFYYHAWNVFWVEAWRKWITADAVFDQVPADVTHVRFTRGEAQEQLDLVGLLGRLELEIKE